MHIHVRMKPIRNRHTCHPSLDYTLPVRSLPLLPMLLRNVDYTHKRLPPSFFFWQLYSLKEYQRQQASCFPGKCNHPYLVLFIHRTHEKLSRVSGANILKPLSHTWDSVCDSVIPYVTEVRREAVKPPDVSWTMTPINCKHYCLC